ncbi:hypothetical protein [uncultured Helicobacter sp.]
MALMGSYCRFSLALKSLQILQSSTLLYVFRILARDWDTKSTPIDSV